MLIDGTNRRSYRGYTRSGKTDNHTITVYKRLRQHKGIVKGGAKYTTRNFKCGCYLLLYITGFKTKHTAMSYEWYSKRTGAVYHQNRLKFRGPHYKTSFFLAPLLHSKFRHILHGLKLHLSVDYFNKTLASRIRDFYGIEVEIVNFNMLFDKYSKKVNSKQLRISNNNK